MFVRRNVHTNDYRFWNHWPYAYSEAIESIGMT